ncbi:MAG TPA: hypothetical protein VGI33_20640 [Paenibacillus sp.]|jgi:hypothetical protein
MYKEIAPFGLVGGLPFHQKERFFCFIKKIEHTLLEAAERTERFRESGSGRLKLSEGKLLRKHMPWSPNFNRFASFIQKFGDHNDWRNDPFVERPPKTLNFSHKTKEAIPSHFK